MNIITDILDFEGVGKLQLTGRVIVEPQVRRIIVGVLQCDPGTELVVQSSFLLVRAGAVVSPDLNITWQEPAAPAVPVPANPGGPGTDGSNNTRPGSSGTNGHPGDSGTHGADGAPAPSLALAFSRKWTSYPRDGFVDPVTGQPIPTPVQPPPMPAPEPPPPPMPHPDLSPLPWYEPVESQGAVTITLTGQEAGSGADGGDGGRGGNGGRGEAAIYLPAPDVASPWGAPGGAAGFGGNGGMGGMGGSGGSGASVYILNELSGDPRSIHVGSVEVNVHNLGGPAGDAGRGGEGEDPGIPGRGGADSHSWGDRQGTGDGAAATLGQDGLSGEMGQYGPMGSTTRRQCTQRTTIQVGHDGFPFGSKLNGYLRDVLTEEFRRFGLLPNE